MDATTLVGSATDSTARAANESSGDGQRVGIRSRKATTGVGVERSLIVGIVVHALDDIDFSPSRPVRTCMTSAPR